MTNKQLFKSVVKGKNFITPKVLAFYKVNKGAVELSQGEELNGNVIFGVTVVRGNDIEFQLSRIFSDKEDAKKYIKSLK